MDDKSSERQEEPVKFDKNFLKKVKVTIYRPNRQKEKPTELKGAVINFDNIAPIRRRDEGKKPIFDRPELKGRLDEWSHKRSEGRIGSDCDDNDDYNTPSSSNRDVSSKPSKSKSLESGRRYSEGSKSDERRRERSRSPIRRDAYESSRTTKGRSRERDHKRVRSLERNHSKGRSRERDHSRGRSRESDHSRDRNSRRSSKDRHRINRSREKLDRFDEEEDMSQALHYRDAHMGPQVVMMGYPPPRGMIPPFVVPPYFRPDPFFRPPQYFRPEPFYGRQRFFRPRYPPGGRQGSSQCEVESSHHLPEGKEAKSEHVTERNIEKEESERADETGSRERSDRERVGEPSS